MFVATDLHGHTFHSDGRATPDEYVEFRRSLGMKAIAIADHDVLAGVRAGAMAAERAGMLFIPALEVTAHINYGESGEEQFHVLAYYPHDVLDGSQLEHKKLYRRGIAVQQMLVQSGAIKKYRRIEVELHRPLQNGGSHKIPCEYDLAPHADARGRHSRGAVWCRL